MQSKPNTVYFPRGNGHSTATAEKLVKLAAIKKEKEKYNGLKINSVNNSKYRFSINNSKKSNISSRRSGNR